MTFVFRVRPDELGDFEKKFGRRMRFEARDALHRSAKRILPVLRAKSVRINDLGEFRDGWTYTLLPKLVLDLWNRAKHAIFVENGRGAGKPMPPDLPIREWAIRHGISNVWALRRAIAERGIRPRRVLSHPATMVGIDKTINAEMQSAWNRLVRRAAR